MSLEPLEQLAEMLAQKMTENIVNGEFTPVGKLAHDALNQLARHAAYQQMLELGITVEELAANGTTADACAMPVIPAELLF